MTRPLNYSPHIRSRSASTPLNFGGIDGPARSEQDYVDLSRILRGARRQALVVASFAAMGLLAAIGYILDAQPTYTASATIYLDEERAELLELVSSLPSAVLGDSAVQSEVEIFKSNELALRVVDRLDLLSEPERLSVEPSLLQTVQSKVRAVAASVFEAIESRTGEEDVAGSEPVASDPRRALAGELRKNLSVERVGRSYVLEITYAAPDPQLATEIADTYAQAYLDFQFEVSSETAESAVGWLMKRVDIMRETSIEANQQLAAYRRDNDLTAVNGVLLSEQQLSEVMSQLIIAEADLAKAGSLASQFDAMLAEGPDAAVGNLPVEAAGGFDSLSGELRTRYVEATQQWREIVRQWGEEHPEAQRLAAELADIQQLVYEQLHRAATSANNVYQAELSRVGSLRKSLADVREAFSSNEATLAMLEQLQQTAATYSVIYQDHLKRLEQAAQRQSVPIVAARVITAPDLPKGQSSPKKAQALVLGLLLGVFAGAGVGVLREVTRKRLRTREDVEHLLGLPFLGRMPRLAAPDTTVEFGQPAARSGRIGAGLRSTKRLASNAVLPRNEDFLKVLRAVKYAVDSAASAPKPGAKTMAFLSPRTGEGKTTVACNFAKMLAASGFKTLLIDADPYQRSISRAIEKLPSELREKSSDSDVVGLGESLFALSLTSSEDPFWGVLRTGGGGMASVFDNVRQHFDYVVVDLPSAQQGHDAHAFNHYVGVVVMITRFSNSREVNAALLDATWDGKLGGILLNAG